jgi:cation diffusion facilitator family transporter
MGDQRADVTATPRDESLASVLVALAANMAIAVAKGTAAALTGSPALFAETLHTVADAGNEVFLYIAIRRSQHPADESHPLGYGPERYYWALLAAIGMFIVGGAVSIWDGVNALLHPRELEAFWAGVVVLVLAIVLDSTSRVVARRQLRVQAQRRGITVNEYLRESPDPTVVTVYFEDTIDVLGALLALLALVLHRLTGSGVPDALGSVVIGLLLCYLASRLTRRNRGLLTNQAVPDRYVQKVRARLEADDAIHAVPHLEAVYLGPGEVLAAADIEMSDGLSGGDVAAALARMRADLEREIPAISRLYLTPVEPAELSRLTGLGASSATALCQRSPAADVLMFRLDASRARPGVDAAQRRLRGVVAAHPVRAGAGWRRGGAEKHTGDAERVRIERGARAEDQLARVVGAGHDVAADVVDVVLLHLGDVADVAREDAVPEARSEALDLRLDRPARVSRVAGGHVRVGVERMHVAVRARRVGEVLLADQHERPLGQLATRREPLRPRDLLQAAADVHGAGAARRLVRPGHAVLHRELDLEGARSVAVARQRPRDPPRHALTGDPHRRGRRDVEQHEVGRPELLQRPHAHAGLQLGAGLLEQRDHRAADRTRAALGDRPAVAVRRGRKRHADRRGHRPAERAKGVGGDAREQRARLVCRPHAREQAGWQSGERAEARELERVCRQVQHRPHEVGGDVVKALAQRAEDRLPAPSVAAQRRCGLLDRAPGRRTAAILERVGVLDLRPAPGQAVRAEVELPRERRVDGQRMRRRALVVNQPRQRQLAAARTATERVGRFEHGHLDARRRERERGSQTVGPAADDDRAGHASTGDAVAVAAALPWLTRS